MKITYTLAVAMVSAAASYGACDANQILGIGSTWAFHANDETLLVGQSSTAMIGTFTIQSNGLLSVTETVDNRGNITRLARAGGRWILNPDCTGGEIMLMVSAAPVQFEFTFTKNFSEMNMVADYFSPQGNPTATVTAVSGHAVRSAAGCPAGIGNSLNLIAGMVWSFETANNYFNNFTASTGLFFPTTVNGAGVLSGTETVSGSILSQTIRQNHITGRFQVYNDCSGGEIMIMNRGVTGARGIGGAQGLQMEFVFAGPNYSTLYMLNDIQGVGLQEVTGIATKF